MAHRGCIRSYRMAHSSRPKANSEGQGLEKGSHFHRKDCVCVELLGFLVDETPKQ